MSTPARNKTLVCEQCGAPLANWTAEEGCLHCLLSTGIEGESEAPAAAPNESMARVYQHYEILSRADGSRWELGRGAMGVTYRARDVNLDTPVALKIINARFSARAEARRRFWREARAAAQLQHANVARVFHFGTIGAPLPVAGEGPEPRPDGGECFYAMEFVEGESLEARLRQSGPLPPFLALELGLQVARALAAAEKRGLVHRDLKPSNIMLAAEEESGSGGRPGKGWVKVIDFGLAKLTHEAGDASRPGRFLGTLAFSSPEQIAAREVDARSDIYSLGVTLLYTLTGELPFSDRSRRAVTEDPAKRGTILAQRGVPPSLVALMESMIAPDPQERPASAAALVQELHGCYAELAGHAVPIGRSRRKHRWALAGTLVAGLVALAVYLNRPAPAPMDKSIAVLPFRNLSDDSANAFFAEGVQDDILSRLARIHDLRVISRSGSAGFSADAPRDARSIGRKLGVDHLVEGSLRRAGDRVLLHVALIDTRNGQEVWSEGYDRKLADAISLQGELAGDIAEALNASLSPQEKVDVRSNSTGNPDAYVLYLQGRKLEGSQTFVLSDFEAAVLLYSQAVALDPGFALAHARLGTALGLLYRFRGPSEELKTRAHEEARQALLLQPGLGEAHLAIGLTYYRVDRDFERALSELEIARRLLPSDTEAESTIAFIRRRQGHWKEARAGLERAHSRDPLNQRYVQELHATACLLRDWPVAAEYAARTVALAPANPGLRAERAMVDFWGHGDLAPVQKFFAGLKSYGDPEGNLTWGRWDTAMLARDFAEAQAALDLFPFETLPSVSSAPVPKTYLEGCIALAQGQAERAGKLFEQARPAFEAEVRAHPESALRHARLGLLYAYMGRKAEAVGEGQRAMELVPVPADAIDGHQWVCHLALIYARIGQPDRAIAMLTSLLREPGCISPLNEASLSLAELRTRWQWDPLRNDPRFQKILAAPEPATVF